MTHHGGLLTELVEEMTPAAAAKANFDFTVDALDSHGITWWLVEDYSGHGYRIGVHFDDKRRVAAALVRRQLATPIYARSGRSGPVALSSVVELAADPELNVITVAAPGRECLLPDVLTENMLEDTTFPVDAVYTWVDRADPEWVASKRRLEAQLAGHEYHPEANHEARFESKDELKYSLRSLEYFAPWFNKVYIVTAGQVPSWLNVDHPKIVMIDHGDIYDDPNHLPTFNSNSIISRHHHIPGLSEHFIYLNDDVMFGKPVRPQDFFLPGGAVKVFPSRNHRPFGAPTA